MLKESADEGRTWQASFVIVARSTDAGVTWTEASRVAGAGYNEASIAVISDGQLMLAMRRTARPVRREVHEPGWSPDDTRDPATGRDTRVRAVSADHRSVGRARCVVPARDRGLHDHGRVLERLPRGNGLFSTQNVAVVNASSFPAVDRLSSRFLRINDVSSASMARTVWRHSISASAVLEFRTRALGTQNQGLLFSISGKSSAGADVWPYHLHLKPDGFLYRYNWATGSWGNALNSTPIPVSSCNTLRLEATPAQATLLANGIAVATIAPSAPSVSLNGNQLASSGTAPVGDDWLIDDLAYQTP